MSFRFAVVFALLAVSPLVGCFHSDTDDPFDAAVEDAGDAATPDDAGTDIGAHRSLVTSVMLGPIDADATSSLHCVPTSSLDPVELAGVTYSYSWTVDDVGIPESGDTLTGSVLAKGVRVRCAVTARDSIHPDASMLSNVVTVGNQPPTVAGASLTPATAFETTVLTCVPGAADDADGDTVELEYAWRVNGALIAPTTATLDGAFFSKRDVVRCVVTPTDHSSDGAAVESEAVTIVDSIPVVTSVVLGPWELTHINDWECHAEGIDADGDSLLFEFDWFSDTRSFNSGTYEKLNGIFFSHGDVVRCRATPIAFDTTTWDRVRGLPLESPPRVVANLAPGLGYSTWPQGSIVRAEVDAGREPLRCEVAVPGSDPDHDPITYSFVWTKNGEPYDGATSDATSSTVPGSDIAIGDGFTCTMVASDGLGGESHWVGYGYGVVPSFTLGYPTPFASPDAGNLSGRVARATPITIPRRVALVRMGFLLQSVGTHWASIALYTDDGGRPGAPVSRILSSNFTGDHLELDAQDAYGRHVVVQPGNYWIVVAFDGDAPLGHATTGLAADIVYSTPVSYYYLPAGGWATATVTVGAALNQYAVFRDE